MYILKALDTSQYPTNIPFFPEGSSLVLFSFGMCTNMGQPNILRWLTYGFFRENISSRVLNPSALWENMLCTYTVVLVSYSHKCIKVLIMDHSLHCFHYSYVLSFCYTILLRIVRSGELPLDPAIFTKFYKLF
jgi:hypothetical protein